MRLIMTTKASDRDVKRLSRLLARGVRRRRRGRRRRRRRRRRTGDASALSRCKKRSLAWKMKERREGDVRTHYLHWLYSTDCTRGTCSCMYVCTMYSTCGLLWAQKVHPLCLCDELHIFAVHFSRTLWRHLLISNVKGRWTNLQLLIIFINWYSSTISTLYCYHLPY